jgi:hypothetical protein
MNNAYKLYQVYCIEEGIFVQLHSFTDPTECPNDHADKTIDTNQTTIIHYIPVISNTSQTLSPKKETMTSASYQDLKCDFFFNKLIMDQITNVKVVGYMDHKATSYDVRAFDVTHNTEIVSDTLTNTDKEVSDLGYIPTSPSEDAIIEFHVKVTRGGGKAHIENIIVYYKQV